MGVWETLIGGALWLGAILAVLAAMVYSLLGAVLVRLWVDDRRFGDEGAERRRNGKVAR